ncbi:unnamed protein product [Victoria cruziana]
MLPVPHHRPLVASSVQSSARRPSSCHAVTVHATLIYLCIEGLPTLPRCSPQWPRTPISLPGAVRSGQELLSPSQVQSVAPSSSLAVDILMEQ